MPAAINSNPALFSDKHAVGVEVAKTLVGSALYFPVRVFGNAHHRLLISLPSDAKQTGVDRDTLWPSCAHAYRRQERPVGSFLSDKT